MESLDSSSVDIARMIDHDAAAELWERYKRGERNVFTAPALHPAGAADLRRRSASAIAATASSSRRSTAISASSSGCSRRSRRASAARRQARTYLTSDTGKVYTMLAHAAGAVRGQRLSHLYG
jgi:hypothetical protein